MLCATSGGNSLESPSIRREWIEINYAGKLSLTAASPSIRREWIEMVSPPRISIAAAVSLHTEGVD